MAVTLADCRCGSKAALGLIRGWSPYLDPVLFERLPLNTSAFSRWSFMSEDEPLQKFYQILVWPIHFYLKEENLENCGKNQIGETSEECCRGECHDPREDHVSNRCPADCVQPL